MDSVGRFTWRAVKFLAVCAALLYGGVVAFEQDNSLNPVVILIIVLIIGAAVRDYLFKDKARREGRA